MKPDDMVLQPSLKLAYLLGVMNFVACVVLLFLPLLMLIKALFLVLVLVSAIYLVLRDILLGLPHSFQRLSLNSKNEIILEQKNGKQLVCRVLPDSVVFDGFTVLRLKLKVDWLPRSLILLSDSADADVFRRWRVWLRWRIKWTRA